MARGPSIEKSMLGDEPTFEGGGSRTDIARGFLYYSYKYSIRDTKKWIVAWMKDNGYTETQQAKYRASSHTDITQTKASIARMLSRGLKDCPLRKQLIDHIDLVLSAKKSAPQSTAKTTSSDSPPNIVIADIDDILDDFYKDNYKTVYEIEVSTESKVTDIRNAHAYYTELLNEVNEVVEGYEHLKRAQKKRYIEQLELIINELVLKGALVKRRKPVRKKKAPSAEKQVAKVPRWIVCFASLFMLIALISGIVIHKRIFKDMFVFRANKGSRSWLDVHNLSSVFAIGDLQKTFEASD